MGVNIPDMDKSRISNLISFEDEGMDASTGHVAVSNTSVPVADMWRSALSGKILQPYTPWKNVKDGPVDIEWREGVESFKDILDISFVSPVNILVVNYPEDRLKRTPDVVTVNADKVSGTMLEETDVVFITGIEKLVLTGKADNISKVWDKIQPFPGDRIIDQIIFRPSDKPVGLNPYGWQALSKLMDDESWSMYEIDVKYADRYSDFEGPDGRYVIFDLSEIPANDDYLTVSNFNAFEFCNSLFEDNRGIMFEDRTHDNVQITLKGSSWSWFGFNYFDEYDEDLARCHWDVVIDFAQTKKGWVSIKGYNPDCIDLDYGPQFRKTQDNFISGRPEMGFMFDKNEFAGDDEDDFEEWDDDDELNESVNRLIDFNIDDEDTSTGHVSVGSGPDLAQVFASYVKLWASDTEYKNRPLQSSGHITYHEQEVPEYYQSAQLRKPIPPQNYIEIRALPERVQAFDIMFDCDRVVDFIGKNRLDRIVIVYAGRRHHPESNITLFGKGTNIAKVLQWCEPINDMPPCMTLAPTDFSDIGEVFSPSYEWGYTPFDAWQPKTHNLVYDLTNIPDYDTAQDVQLDNFFDWSGKGYWCLRGMAEVKRIIITSQTVKDMVTVRFDQLPEKYTNQKGGLPTLIFDCECLKGIFINDAESLKYVNDVYTNSVKSDMPVVLNKDGEPYGRVVDGIHNLCDSEHIRGYGIVKGSYDLLEQKHNRR